MKKLYSILSLCLLLTLCGVFISCGKNGEAKDKEQEDVVLIPVEVSRVSTDDISALLTGTATLEAEEEAEVVAKTSEIVIEILVEEGMPVKKGQVLARLENKMLAIEVQQAQADINKLENDFNRNKELFGKNLISKEEFQNVRFQYEAQKAQFDKAKLNLEYTSIKAPISGVVAARYIKNGNMVNLNQPVFKIVNFNPLIALLYVPEVDIHKIKLGQKAEISLDATNGTAYQGSVWRISPIVDPESGTVKVTVAVKDEYGALKPGMFARVKIIYDTHENSLLIPKHAILSEDGSETVFVIKDSTAIRQVVETGYSNDLYFEIISGLSPGDQVVVVGQNGLKDSSKVEIVQ